MVDLQDVTGGSAQADHLCVLVHGLWGNPAHMTNIAKALRAKYSEDKVYILAAKRNTGSFTYDGIELGGERVCVEIEEELQMIESKGGKIKKLSIVGYSLGGLVARYAIGLLYANGVLNDLECMNFTAFASPFLGVRTPLRGLSNYFWNVLAARTLCQSGRQLFGIDTFRDTGRPLLAVLAEPNSIFISGLRKFRRRTLYANIVNDLSAVYYTTAIDKTDPFADLTRVEVNYVPGYEDVILDPVDPVRPRTSPRTLAAIAEIWARRLPFILALSVFLPLGLVAYLTNAAVQTVRSSRRVRQHEMGLAGIRIEKYRVPLWIEGVREAVEGAYENLNSAQGQQYLAPPEDGAEAEAEAEAGVSGVVGGGGGVGSEQAAQAVLESERKQSSLPWPTLALAPYQFAAIQTLDSVGWRKYRVWIHRDRHSHAAIVVRMDKDSFEEGRLVLRHWLNEEFLY